MKFACLSTVIPGRDLAERCAIAARAGCGGLETIISPATALDAWQAECGKACVDADIVPAVVILGGLALDTPDQAVWIDEAMHAICELGANVLVTPEYRPQDPLPIFPPYAPPPKAGAAQVARNLDAIVSTAAKLGLHIYGEPLTPFESAYWRDVESVLAVCRRLDSPYFGVALDLHNMLLTESDSAAAILRAGPWVGHVHLADSNRRVPGQGQIDFRRVLPAFNHIGYSDWYSFECAVLPHNFLDGRGPDAADAAAQFVQVLSRCRNDLSALLLESSNQFMCSTPNEPV